jgi:inhibitor of cysteine peptidase
MRKQWLLVLGVLALAMSTGCVSSTVTETVTRTINETLVINEVISVESGQEFTIPLSSNPSTGCKWYETHNLSLLAFVEKVYQPSQPQPTDGSIIVGGGGTDFFRFKALEKGKSIIVFEYKSPGSVPGGSQVVEKKVIEVEVK